MKSNADTTLTGVALPKPEGSRATIRLLYDGHEGPVEWPTRTIRPRAIRIGRTADNEGIPLSDPRASREHLKVWSRSKGREVFFEDTSTNGTFINGLQRAKGNLVEGDIIRAGDSFLLIRYEPHQPTDAAEITSIVGGAPAISRLRRTISMVGPTDATILIIGDSGTGKELVARETHEISDRQGPFVPVNCSAIPATLAESQLFGHVAGSFTGAREHRGFFRSAHGGTLFLDEVGELPLEIQPKLLRVLEESVVTPVGGSHPIPVDVRIVAATNRDLENALDNEMFRGDLFARLAEITIRTPLLKDRQEDILPLFKLAYGEHLPKLSADLVEAMLLYAWPFNVRELFKVAKELKILGAGSSELDLSMVEHRFTKNKPSPNDTTEEVPLEEPKAAPQLPRVITKTYDAANAQKLIPTKDEIEQLLKETNGNISALSRKLHRSRRQIHRYLKMYSLSAEDFRDE